jgi:hypothetical protein
MPLGGHSECCYASMAAEIANVDCGQGSGQVRTAGSFELISSCHCIDCCPVTCAPRAEAGSLARRLVARANRRNMACAASGDHRTGSTGCFTLMRSLRLRTGHPAHRWEEWS